MALLRPATALSVALFAVAALAQDAQEEYGVDIVSLYHNDISS